MLLIKNTNFQYLYKKKIMTKYSVKLNNVDKIEQLLQETYELA